MLLALFALPACDRTRDDPPVAEAPEVRLIALSPALAVIIRDLGRADLVVGRHTWDMGLNASIPTVGTHDDPDLETMLRLRPTHIIVQEMQTRVPQSLRRMAEQQNWTIWSYPLLTLDDITAAVDGLHDAMNDATNSPTTDSPAARLTTAWAPHAEAPKAGRVLILAGVDPAGAMGPGSFHHQLIERLGARPALTDGGPWQELDHEDILRLAPDSILLFRPGVDVPDGADPAVALTALGGIADLDIPGVRHGRVAIINHPLGLLPASSLGEVADQIRAAFEAWAEANAPVPAGAP
jgi:ABC-type hemin transport system substrate-binding protein